MKGMLDADIVDIIHGETNNPKALAQIICEYKPSFSSNYQEISLYPSF